MELDKMTKTVTVVASMILAVGISWGTTTANLDKKADSERVAIIETRQVDDRKQLTRIENKLDRLINGVTAQEHHTHED